MDTRQIKIEDFDYPLPDERIAKFPLTQRDHSKLLVYRSGEVSTFRFDQLPDLLPSGALMVFNNTKVIQARLHFRKSTGALIEVFLLEPVLPSDYQQIFQTTRQCTWKCLVGNQKKWKNEQLRRWFNVGGMEVELDCVMEKEREAASPVVTFSWNEESVSFADILESVGELPIPPYLNRKTQESDKITYQTVYSKIKGSVAAPTAGLHFTENVLHRLDEKGIIRRELTLHVGAGTFKPVKSERIANHEMHAELVVVSRELIEQLLKHKASAIAVGTTSVRTLESLYYIGRKVLKNPQLPENQLPVSQWEPYDSHEDVDEVEALQALLRYMDEKRWSQLTTSTQIIIAPGYHYHMVKMLVTNFHQPKSTLLLLVSAFVNGDWRKIYDYALSHHFRFLSYGDSSLLIP